METIKCDSGKKNFLLKTWKRCQSLPPICSGRGGVWGLAKIKSWSGRENTTEKVTPKGCIPVCVGPEKQRFAVKIKYASHPLFSMLLEADAQTEDGYDFEGPILLPWDVNLFKKVLAEIEGEQVQQLKWSSIFAYGSCSSFNPSRRLKNNGVDEMVKSGHGSYIRLTH